MKAVRNVNLLSNRYNSAASCISELYKKPALNSLVSFSKTNNAPCFWRDNKRDTIFLKKLQKNIRNKLFTLYMFFFLLSASPLSFYFLSLSPSPSFSLSLCSYHTLFVCRVKNKGKWQNVVAYSFNWNFLSIDSNFSFSLPSGRYLVGTLLQRYVNCYYFPCHSDRDYPTQGKVTYNSYYYNLDTVSRWTIGYFTYFIAYLPGYCIPTHFEHCLHIELCWILK